MAQILEMPRLSDTMQEGRLLKWHKKEGDKIAPGDVIAEVETDKANMDYEAYDEGVLLKILVHEGGTAPVGGPVAILGAAGEDVSELLGTLQSGEKAAPPKPAPAPTPAGNTRTGTDTDTHTHTDTDTRTDTAARTGTGTAKPTPPTPGGNGTGAAASAPRPGARVVASPLARRIAQERGIDIAAISGTGPGGRIVRRDVEEWQGEGHGHAPVPMQAQAAAPGRAASVAPSAQVIPHAGDAEQPLSMMRKTIARRMVEAKQQVPHFYLTAEVDMDAAAQFRKQVNDALGIKISYNDLVVKACALTLRRIPQVNASFAGDRILLHSGVHIGVAVAIEAAGGEAGGKEPLVYEGLVTPIVRDADAKSLGTIAREVAELAARARARKLRPEDYTGGTFTVSNLGMFGIEEFSAIVNPPEAAILAVGAVRKQPIVKNDQITIGHRMRVTLSGDHRVIDGATGARFLQEMLRILEHPMTLAM